MRIAEDPTDRHGAHGIGAIVLSAARIHHLPQKLQHAVPPSGSMLFLNTSTSLHINSAGRARRVLPPSLVHDPALLIVMAQHIVS